MPCYKPGCSLNIWTSDFPLITLCNFTFRCVTVPKISLHWTRMQYNDNVKLDSISQLEYNDDQSHCDLLVFNHPWLQINTFFSLCHHILLVAMLAAMVRNRLTVRIMDFSYLCLKATSLASYTLSIRTSRWQLRKCKREPLKKCM